MERDYFAEEVEGQAPVDFYQEEVMKKIPNTNSFLDRALKSFMPTKKSPMQMVTDLATPGLNTHNLGQETAQNIAETATDNKMGQFGMMVAADTLATGFGARKAIGGLAGKIGSSASKAKSTVGEAFQSGKNLRNVDSAISSVDESIVGAKNQRGFLDKALSKESLSQSGVNKKKIASMASKNTGIYGDEIEKIETSLASSGKMPDTSSYLDRVLNKTIMEAEELGLPTDSPALSKVRSYANRFSPKPVKESIGKVDMIGMPIKETAENTVRQLDFNELKNMRNSIYKRVSSQTRGGAFSTPDDEVANIFIKNHGEFLGSMSDEIGVINKEFAPYAQSRNFGFKAFKPYRAEESQRGANILKKLSTGKYNQDDLNYITQLEKGSGRFSGAGDLRGGTTELGQKLQSIDKQIDTLKLNKSNLLKDRSKYQKLLNTRNSIIKEIAKYVGVGTAVGVGTKVLS